MLFTSLICEPTCRRYYYGCVIINFTVFGTRQIWCITPALKTHILFGEEPTHANPYHLFQSSRTCHQQTIAFNPFCAPLEHGMIGAGVSAPHIKRAWSASQLPYQYQYSQIGWHHSCRVSLTDICPNFSCIYF